MQDLSLNPLENLPLAPLADINQAIHKRNNLDQCLFQRSPWPFIKKLMLCLLILMPCYALLLLNIHWLINAGAILILGLMYAHMVELQHECLHELAFKDTKKNRLFGFLLGIPMLSSYSHYKYDHALHHAYLGTKTNREFFNYAFQQLNSLFGFLRGTFNLQRYADVTRHINASWGGYPIKDIKGNYWQKRIKQEYIVLSLIFLASLVFTLITHHLFFVYAWYIPMLCIAEAAHFLIELPEHYGLNTITKPNVFENTRTIKTNRFFAWFTNYNNLHTAHHYHHQVPITNIPKLHHEIQTAIVFTEKSYWEFYWKVITGKIIYIKDENCMTR